MMDELVPIAAELKVIAAAAEGEMSDFRVGDESKDDPAGGAAWGDERAVRAEIVRALCVGTRPDWPVHAKGVQIRGARIAGALDVESAVLRCPLVLMDCHIAECAVFDRAAIPALYVLDSMVEHGIAADGLTVKGSLSLRDTTTKGGVSLIGAEIGGQLTCEGATFANTDGAAFIADGLTVKSDVVLDDTTAKGEVRLIGVGIGGQLSCERATFENPGGTALNLRAATIYELFLQSLKAPPNGVLDLSHTRVGTLADDPQSWPTAGSLRLAGFTYESFAPGAPADAASRLNWLRRQPPQSFSAQPYEQLTRLLRQMGHDRDARIVAMAKQDDLLAFAKRSPGIMPWYQRLWMRIKRETVGYGYEIWRPWLFLTSLWLVGFLMFGYADQQKIMTPNKERVYLDASVKHAIAEGVDPRKSCYNPFSPKPERSAQPQEYPCFNPLIYSLDLIVPFMDLHQEEYWAPNGVHEWADIFKWWKWSQIILGWVFASLAVGGLSGIVKKD